MIAELAASKQHTSQKKVVEVHRLLQCRYGDFCHYNKKNPLAELLFILCSVRTDERKYLQTYLALRRAYPRFEDLAAATEPDIAKAIAYGGLSKQKAFAIAQCLLLIRKQFGRATLSPLRRMTDESCEKFLTSLPYVGKKVARCIMMYALDRHVFPVDTHCWRICRRLGWIRPTKPDRTCSQRDMDRLQEKVPPPIRRSLHVNLLSLGRDVCIAGFPRCHVCPLRGVCPRVGVKGERRE